MSNISDKLLKVTSLGKCYQLFEKPHQRLLSYFFPHYKKLSRPFWALKEVSFTLSKGETVGIIGRNGSGKSTLLQMIAGTLTETTGVIEQHGRVAALLELGAGFNPEFTGRENIILNAAIYGLSTAEIEARLEQIITFAELGDFIDQPVAHYSSGMFVRLAFSVITHVDADLLIIDEALAVGDAAFSQKCMRFLEAFKKHGAILFVSHDAGTVTQLCDKALWLDKGEVQVMGEAKAVSEAYLKHIYSVQQQVEIQLPSTHTHKSCLPPSFDAWHDARSELLQHSNLCNEIKLLPFSEEKECFGTGLIRIDNVTMLDIENRALNWAIGGSKVILCINFSALADLQEIIVGFIVKNRKGQSLFGDNNSITHQNAPISVNTGKAYQARFGLTLPYLPEDDYAVTIAVASGAQADHVQHCWQHEALMFAVVKGHVVHGLMGVPLGFCDITLLTKNG
ncbi:MAG: ABC transporter ATP-binding protein [Gammaproteobacteria bacterium]|nr:MAG: ABC transporter ATP-binding protein [Gammaproteobacteria bacterium]